LAKVKALLKDNPGLISSRDSRDGYTPLLPAAAYDRKDVVEFLLAKNAEVDAKDNGVGWTPYLCLGLPIITIGLKEYERIRR
jgi:hypothetical protein